MSTDQHLRAAASHAQQAVADAKNDLAEQKKQRDFMQKAVQAIHSGGQNDKNREDLLRQTEQELKETENQVQQLDQMARSLQQTANEAQQRRQRLGLT